jgi:two-component system, response regulator PdtaR
MIMRILIVEDEAIIALCIGLTLQQAGHEVMGPA